MRRFISALVLMATLLGGLSSAQAMPRPERSTSIDEFRITWRCDGPDIHERTTIRVDTIRFPRADDGTRRIFYHFQWRGWMRDRETGERVANNADWNEIRIVKSGRTVRVATLGAYWRVVIPGEGIVFKQIGRWVRDRFFNVLFETPHAVAVKFPQLCRYL
jgi:hypothetical protein